MKYLIIPGLPLLLIGLTLHDEGSPPALIAYLIAVCILILGGAFLLFYAFHHFIRKSHNSHLTLDP